MLTAEGVVRCRSIMRKCEAERWDVSILDHDFSVLQPTPLQPGQVRVGVRVPNANFANRLDSSLRGHHEVAHEKN